MQGAAEPGDTVVVRSAAGEFLGRAAFSPTSQIRARMWTFREAETIDEAFLSARLAAAVSARASLAGDTNAVRLVFGENDGLPGLVVDRYGDVAVAQFLGVGPERWKPEIVAALREHAGVATVLERSEAGVRKLEGLPPVQGVLVGEQPGEPIEIWEKRNGSDETWTFAVDVLGGHKTGFYLDQRVARGVVAGLSAGQRVLNMFGYTGGFSVAAYRGGATHVTTVDSSAPALALAERNLAVNGCPPGDLVKADAFSDLRARRDRGERYGLIILDPPKLAANEREIPRAARAYKDINWLACRLLEPGGHLVTFSCSGAISDDLFAKIVAGGALDAGRELAIVARLDQPADHPVRLSFPEGRYLKGLVARAD